MVAAAVSLVVFVMHGPAAEPAHMKPQRSPAGASALRVDAEAWSLVPTTTTTTTAPPTTSTTVVVRRARSAPTVRSSSAGPAVIANGGTVWDRIADCETGHTMNWSLNTGNSYYGGLQENMTFWNTYGPHAFDQDGHDIGLVAARPDLASREQQITAAQRAHDGYAGQPPRGYSPWPACSRSAGLR